MIDRFDREVTCTYRGETYRVRDNGAVFRLRGDRARPRKLDEKWTFGRADKSTRSVHAKADTYRGRKLINC